MPIKKHYQTLRLILGDQLNVKHSWFKQPDDSTLYVIAELHQEANYVRHHIQKLCSFFLAMQNFAEALQTSNYNVLHLSLDDTAQYADLPSLLADLVKRFSIEEFHYQRPDEYRLLNQMRALDLGVPIEECDTEHFLLPFEELKNYINAGKHNRMETFYRKMRKRFDLLMENDQPLGGKWNYDGENRDRIKPKDEGLIPQPLVFANDVRPILERINKHKVPHFGEAHQQLLWPVTRRQSLQLLKHFCEQCLPLFGRFQDAMLARHPDRWSMFHSRLSFAINSKILQPMEVMQAAISAFEKSNGKITLPQIEGFVRQILGWREYIRGVYWQNMPSYHDQNALAANRDLPGFFWTGETKMECMKQSIGQSLEYAYAHHIQRLMITGNFCLITGIDPQQVDDWYLGVYIDAIEWVELPNTRGMSQFADGGWVATKPYAAGGNYVNKMSDYCKHCHYNVREKYTENACPANSLYWHFMNRHRERLVKNPRIGMIYRSWDKQTEDVREATMARAEWCLENIEHL